MASPVEDRDRIVVYADYVCPFCYLGHRSLERYLEDRERRGESDLAVEWRPFDLRRGKRDPDGSIDHSRDDGKDEAYFEQARANVRRLQDRYDVEMAREFAGDVDSLPAQLASLFVAAEHPDRWWSFDDAVYEALWVDERAVDDPAVLADLAERAGLSGSAVRDVVDDEAYRDRLEDAFADAHRRGITGVPTFVYGDHVARGAVPPEQLRRLVEGT